MPDQNATDLVMKFKFEGKPVWAECALQVDPNDKLMDDFGKNTGYDNYAEFFEVSGFDFGLSLKEKDEDSSNGPSVRQIGGRSGGTGGHGGQAGQQGKPRAVPFSAWRNALGKTYKDIHFPLEFDDFNFERTIDAASPLFFECCCNSKTFESAALVKRLSVGDGGGNGITFGESLAQVAFLRIDFTEVLITSISWDDGDVVKEKVSFICKKMKIRYRQQAMSGKIMEGKDEINWPNPKNDRTLGVRTGTGGP